MDSVFYTNQIDMNKPKYDKWGWNFVNFPVLQYTQGKYSQTIHKAITTRCTSHCFTFSINLLWVMQLDW